MSVRHKLLLAISILGLALAVFSACSDGSSDALGPGAGQGQLLVMLHDDGKPGFSEAHVTISAASAIAADGTLVPLAGEEVEVDLLTLQDGAMIELAADILPAGEYSGLLLVLTKARLVTDEGTTITIELPPGGVEKEVPVSFVVIEGEATTITLDFRVDLSFKCNEHGCRIDPEIIVDRVDDPDEGDEHHDGDSSSDDADRSDDADSEDERDEPVASLSGAAGALRSA
jgi:hypothetical protein